MNCRGVVAVCALLTASTASIAADETDRGWLCIADSSVGYLYHNDKQWRPTTFNVTGIKYVIRRGGPEDRAFANGRVERAAWVVAKMGEGVTHTCLREFNEDGYISCGITGTTNAYEGMLFNKNTLRYQLHFLIGYMVRDFTGDVEKNSTPGIEIGRCTKL